MHKIYQQKNNSYCEFVYQLMCINTSDNSKEIFILFYLFVFLERDIYFFLFIVCRVQKSVRT